MTSSILSLDWTGLGEGAGLQAGSSSRVSAGRTSRLRLRLRRLGQDSVVSGSGNMAEKRHTGDAEARRLPDSFRGEPRAVARRHPTLPSRTSPRLRVPGSSPPFLSRATAALSSGDAENSEPCFAGWGVRFRDVRVQSAQRRAWHTRDAPTAGHVSNTKAIAGARVLQRLPHGWPCTPALRSLSLGTHAGKEMLK